MKCLASPPQPTKRNSHSTFQVHSIASYIVHENHMSFGIPSSSAAVSASPPLHPHLQPSTIRQGIIDSQPGPFERDSCPLSCDEQCANEVSIVDNVFASESGLRLHKNEEGDVFHQVLTPAKCVLLFSRTTLQVFMLY